MVEYSIRKNDDRLDSLFHALSDRTRRRLLEKVKYGPKRVTDLAGEFDVSLNAVSKHLKVLEKADLIHRTVEGRVHLCSPNPDELAYAEKWIETYTRFWADRLDNLEKYINKKITKKKENK